MEPPFASPETVNTPLRSSSALMNAQVEKNIQEILAQVAAGECFRDLLDLQAKNFSVAEHLRVAKEAATPKAYLLACAATRLNIARSHLTMHAALAEFPCKSLFDAFLKVPHLELQRTLEMARQAGFDCAIDPKVLQKVKVRDFYELRIQDGSPQAWQEYLDWEKEPDLKLGLYQRLLWESENSQVAVPRNELWPESILQAWKFDLDLAKLWAVQAPSCDAVLAFRRILKAPTPEKPAGELDATALLCIALDEVFADEDMDKFFTQVRLVLGKNPSPLWMRRVLDVAQLVDRERADKLWKKEGDFFAEYFIWLRPTDASYCQRVVALELPEALEEKKWVNLMMGKPLKMLQAIVEQRKQARNQAIGPQISKEDPEQRSREAYTIIAKGSREVVDTLRYRSIITTEHTHLIELNSESEKDQALALLRYKNLEAYDAANTTVWVTNFAPGQDLRALGAQYGQVLAVRTPYTGGRFAYIQFEQAQEALAMVKNVPAPIVAKISDPKTRQNRSGAVDEGRQLHVSGFLFSSDVAAVKAWVHRNSVYSPLNIVVPEGKPEAKPEANDQRNQGYAFVEYETLDAANEALVHFNSLNYCGRQVRASVCKRKRRHANPHTLSVSNVQDAAALQRLVNGDVKVEGDRATIVFDTAQEAARASLQLAGATIGGATIKVEQFLKPRRQR